MHLIKKLSTKLNVQSMAVSLCIFAVCIGTQQMQTAAWFSGIIEFSRDSLGVLMAIILFTNYRWNDFKKYKSPYIIWSVLGIILGVIFTPMVIAKREEYL